jgi:hypothetical protein
LRDCAIARFVQIQVARVSAQFGWSAAVSAAGTPASGRQASYAYATRRRFQFSGSFYILSSACRPEAGVPAAEDGGAPK